MFKVIATDAAARVGCLTTHHGILETPLFIPVATKGAIKTLTPEETQTTGTQAIILNALHLYLHGLDKITAAGGIHRFMKWPAAIFSDSGGFQSIKNFPCTIQKDGIQIIHPQGAKELLTPQKSIQIQETLGSDIIFSLDDCPPYPSPPERVILAVNRTIAWARSSKKKNVFAILQGGTLPGERIRCAQALAKEHFSGYALGGLCIGEPKQEMYNAVEATLPHLPPAKPRHLMGVGSPHDILNCIEKGIDIFDSAFPTRNARHGTLLTGQGKINLGRANIKGEIGDCSCYTCQNYSLDYLNYLFKIKEFLGLRLASIHNLHFLNTLLQQARESIKSGDFDTFKKNWLKDYSY